MIHNRLFVTASNPEQPFPLQIDAAVLYGRNQLEIDPDTPFSEVRQIPSDWNTYLLPSLPATPIANPGRASINAALNPAPNPPPGDVICRDLPKPDECFYFFYVLGRRRRYPMHSPQQGSSTRRTSKSLLLQVFSDGRPFGCGDRVSGDAQLVPRNSSSSVCCSWSRLVLRGVRRR